MTVKQIFKSTTFKCIAVVLAISLFCGVLLTVCNSLFAVSEQELFDRAISKIYGESVETEDAYNQEFALVTDAEVLAAYKVKKDGNYLVKVKGLKGFSGGNVTCWVVVKIDSGKVSGVGNVVIDSNEGQSYIGNITDKYLSSFSKEYQEDVKFEPTPGASIQGGATFTAKAISNAVNGAISYVKAAALGEAPPVVETPNPYKDFKYADKIDVEKTTYTVKGGNVNYAIVISNEIDGSSLFNYNVTVDANKTITSFEISKDGTTPGGPWADAFTASKQDALKTLMVGKTIEQLEAAYGTDLSAYSKLANKEGIVSGATYSSFTVVYAAMFAAANYDLAVENFDIFSILNHTDTINTEKTTITVENGEVKYSITINGTGGAGEFVYDITVGADGKITAISLVTDGSTPGTPFPETFAAGRDTLIATLVGKDIAELENVYGVNVNSWNSVAGKEGVISGATDSSYTCIAAAIFAASNSPICLEVYGGTV